MEIRDDPVIWREKGGTGIMALFEIDESSGLPVWVQLRNRFVYLNTVSKVYVNLESDGYVESIRGRGVFVRDIGSRGDDVLSVADTEIEGCIRRCLALGMSIDDVKLRLIDVAHRIQDEKS